jgi:integrase
MPHHPKPFFKPKRNTWYLQVGTSWHTLGKHPEGMPPPKKRGSAWDVPREILDAYHAKMAELQVVGENAAVAATTAPAVATVLDQFIGWLNGRVAEGSKAARTLRWYSDYLASFLEFLRTEERGKPEVPSLTSDELQPLHVYRWVDSHADWKSGKRGAMIAVSRAFNWAAKAGLLKALGGRSPLVGLEKPPQGRREQLVSPDEFVDILSWVKDQPFTDLLEASWDTGARPHELFTVEARHVDLANARWVFAPPQHAVAGHPCAASLPECNPLPGPRRNWFRSLPPPSDTSRKTNWQTPA